LALQFIWFIVLSAFLHAFYNFLMRRAGGDEGFLLTMFLAASGLAAGIAVLMDGLTAIPWRQLPYVYGASFFYIQYQILVSKAYESGNISTLYPLTVLSPIFIPIWAFFFLSETISFVTGASIVLTVVGATLTKIQAVTLQEFKKIIRFHKEYAGARLALGASFVYSFGAIFDKSRIASFPLTTYLFIIIGFMTFNMIVYWHFWKKQTIVPVVLSYWKAGILGGLIVYFSFLLFRVALKEVFVSLAVPVRQVAIIFAILLGVLFLKEKIEPRNVIGSVIVILGIVLINAGV
jgi:drug/metabolite transporter (DMT)-like permease